MCKSNIPFIFKHVKCQGHIQRVNGLFSPSHQDTLPVRVGLMYNAIVQIEHIRGNHAQL